MPAFREINLPSDVFWSVVFSRMKQAKQRWILVIDDDLPLLTGKGITSQGEAENVLIDKLDSLIDDDNPEESEVR